MTALPVLYPFIEDAFCETTAGAVAEIKRLAAARTADPLIVVDKRGRISDLLKKEGLPFTELPMKRPVHPRTFFISVFFRLFSSSLPLFVFLKQNPVALVHFHDLTSALTWASAIKMYRIPYIVSLPAYEKTSRYGVITLKDAGAVACPSQTIKDVMRPWLRERVKIVPTAVRVPFINEKQAVKMRRDFLKNEKLSETDLIFAAETGDNKQPLAETARKISETTGKKTVVFAAKSKEPFQDSRLRFVEDGELEDILPFCHAFLAMKPLCQNSPLSYRAMLSGLSVFAPAEGVYPEFILENETGFLMRTFDPEEQAAFIAQKAGDPSLLSETGARAKESMELMFKNTESLWKNLYAGLIARRRGFFKK